MPEVVAHPPSIVPAKKLKQWNDFILWVNPEIKKQGVSDEMLDSDVPFEVGGKKYASGKEYTDSLFSQFSAQNKYGSEDISLGDVPAIQGLFNELIDSTNKGEFDKNALMYATKDLGLDPTKLSMPDGRVGSLTRRYYFPMYKGAIDDKGLTPNPQFLFPSSWSSDPNLGLQKDDRNNRSFLSLEDGGSVETGAVEIKAGERKEIYPGIYLMTGDKHKDGGIPLKIKGKPYEFEKGELWDEKNGRVYSKKNLYSKTGSSYADSALDAIKSKRFELLDDIFSDQQEKYGNESPVAEDGAQVLPVDENPIDPPKGVDPQKVISDFIATVDASPNLSREQLLGKFPEFQGNYGVLDMAFEYRDKLGSGNYESVDQLNAEYPTLFPQKKSPVQSGETSTTVSEVVSQSPSPLQSASTDVSNIAADVLKGRLHKRGAREDQLSTESITGPDFGSETELESKSSELNYGISSDQIEMRDNWLEFKKAEKDLGIDLEKFVKQESYKRFLNDTQRQEFDISERIEKASLEIKEASNNPVHRGFVEAKQKQLDGLMQEYDKLKSGEYAGLDLMTNSLTQLIASGKTTASLSELPQTELGNNIMGVIDQYSPTSVDGERVDLKKLLSDVQRQKGAFFKSRDEIAEEYKTEITNFEKAFPQISKMKPAQKLEALYFSKVNEFYRKAEEQGMDMDAIMSGGTDSEIYGGGILGAGKALWGRIRGTELAKLYSEIKELAPIVTINRDPLSNKEDGFFQVLGKTFLSGTADTEMDRTLQQEAGTISDALEISDSSDGVLDRASENVEKNIKPYESWSGNAIAQLLGSTGAVIIPAATGGGIFKGALSLGRFGRGLLRSKSLLSKALISGGSYTTGGKIFDRQSEELDFGSGVAGELGTALVGNKYLKALVKSPIFKNVFGNKLDDAAKIVGNFVGKGTGETFEETAQTLYQTYRDSDSGEAFKKSLEDQFGEVDDALFFALSSFVLGGVMGSATDIGGKLTSSSKEAYDALPEDDKQKYDEVVSSFEKAADQEVEKALEETIKGMSEQEIQSEIDKEEKVIESLEQEKVKEGDTFSIEVEGEKISGNKADIEAQIMASQEMITALKETKSGDSLQDERDSSQLFESKTDAYSVKNEGGQLVLTDRLGEVSGPDNRSKDKKEAVQKYKDEVISTFESAPTYTPTGEDPVMDVVENSKSPVQVADAYLQEVENAGVYNPIEEVITTVTPTSFNRFGDRNKLDAKTRMTWISDKDGQGIDQIAEQLRDMNIPEPDGGWEDAIVEYIYNNPSGSKKDLTRVKKAADKFKSLTGIPLDKTYAQKIVGLKDTTGKDIAVKENINDIEELEAMKDDFQGFPYTQAEYEKTREFLKPKGKVKPELSKKPRTVKDQGMKSMVEKLKKGAPKVKVNFVSEEELERLSGANLSIIGEKGAKNAGKQNTLQVAKQMKDEGLSPEKIHKATGWEQGADGKWKYDLLDEFSPRFTEQDLKQALEGIPQDTAWEVRLSYAFENPELYKAYPDLEYIKLKFVNNEGQKGRGVYNKETDTITINARKIQEELLRAESDSVPGSGELGTGSLRRLIAHEVQHAIQDIEGFAKGANPFDDMGLYRVSAGEVEANNVSRRSKMTSDDRRQIPPSRTELIPRKDQLVRFSKNGVIYGAFDPTTGQVYYNAEAFNPESTVEEFGHLWIKVVESVNPALFEAGKRLARNSVYYQELLSDPYYSKLPEWVKEEEAWAKAISDKGAKLRGVNKGGKALDTFRDLMGKFWDTVKDYLRRAGIKFDNSVNFNTITLEKLVGKANRELMRGRPWTYTSSEDIAKKLSGEPGVYINVEPSSIANVREYKESRHKRQGLFSNSKGAGSSLYNFIEKFNGRKAQFRIRVKNAWGNTIPLIDKELKGKPEAEQNDILTAISNYMSSSDASFLTDFSEELREGLMNARILIDGFTSDMASLLKETKDDVIAGVNSDLELYLTKNYEADKTYQREKFDRQAARDREQDSLLRMLDPDLDKKRTEVLDEVAKLLLENKQRKTQEIEAQLQKIRNTKEDGRVNKQLEALLLKTQELYDAVISGSPSAADEARRKALNRGYEKERKKVEEIQERMDAVMSQPMTDYQQDIAEQIQALNDAFDGVVNVNQDIRLNEVQDLVDKKYRLQEAMAVSKLNDLAVEKVEFSEVEPGVFDIRVDHVDGSQTDFKLGQKEISALFPADAVKKMLTDGKGVVNVSPKVLQKNRLYQRLMDNKGKYVNRSYRAYNNPKVWKKSWKKELQSSMVEMPDGSMKSQFEIAYEFLDNKYRDSRVSKVKASKNKSGVAATFTNIYGVEVAREYTEDEWNSFKEGNGGFINNADFKRINAALSRDGEFEGEIIGRRQVMVPFSKTANEIEVDMGNFATKESAVAYGNKSIGDVSEFKGNIFKAKDEAIPEPVRFLLGELTDPRLTVSKTLLDQSLGLAHSLFVKELIEGSGLLGGSDPKGVLGAWIAGKESSQHKVKLTASELYMLGKAYEDQEIWVTPEAKELLFPTAAQRRNALMMSIGTFSGALKLLYTVGNPESRARNFLSSPLNFFATGNHRYSTYSKAAQVASSDFTKAGKMISTFTDVPLTIVRMASQLKRLSTEEINSERERVALLGLMEGSLEEQYITDLYGSSTTGLRKVLDNKVVRAASEGYSASDNTARLAIFYSEVETLKKANEFNKKSGKPFYTDEEIDQMAADNAKRMYPFYSRMPGIIKEISKFPLLGTFVMWSAAMTSTRVHIFAQGVRELKSNNPVLMKKGAQRLSSLALQSAMTYALSKVAQYLFGYDDDDESAYRTVSPDFAKNDIRLFLGPKEPAWTNINLTYVDPSSMFYKPVVAAVNSKNIGSGIYNALTEFSSPYLDMDIFTGALMQSLYLNKTDYGSAIYKSYDSEFDKLWKGSKHVAEKIISPQVQLYNKATKSFTGETGKNGQVYNIERFVMGWVLGVKTERNNLQTSFLNNVGDLETKFQDIERDYKKGKVSKSQYVSKSKEYLEAAQQQVGAFLYLGNSESLTIDLFEANKWISKRFIGEIGLGKRYGKGGPSYSFEKKPFEPVEIDE